MIFTSEVEKTVYDFIKDSKEAVTFEVLKKRLGDKAVGYIGKLKQRDLVEIVRELNPKIRRFDKVIKIKEVK